MLRHLGQHGGGVLVYTQNLLRELLSLESPHEFVLIYRDSSLVGTHAGSDRVREVSVAAPATILWDQWAVPSVSRREGLDLIFNPKYSVPLAGDTRSVFVNHGMDWYVMPAGSKWVDRLSHQFLVPRYARKAERIICVSNTARDHAIEFLGVEEERVQTIYLGVDEAFRKPIESLKREEIRQKYRLPERFFLYCGQIYPPKNFGRLVQAYARVGPGLGIPLVVAGAHTWLSEDEIRLIERLQIGDWVVRPGWIGREELPVFYALAEALLLPSLYEACPLPILEAMASGCPVVTANRHGTRELAGPAGRLVDPEDVESIAAGIREIATDSELRAKLVAVGRERARDFTWERCARETLRVLEAAHPEASAAT